MYNVLLLLLLIAPSFTLAAYSVQNLITGLMGFFNTVLIPFILGLAFLVFVFNAIRYFVYESNSTEGQENARNVALYSIGAFVFILSFWGIVNILNTGIGLRNNPCADEIKSDYIVLNDDIGTYPCPEFGGGDGGGDDDPIIVTPLPDPGDAEAAARDANLATISNNANTSYTTDFTTLYGANKDIVANTLFPDLIHPKTTATDLDRLRGAHRLSSAGIITTPLLTSYFNNVNAYYTQTGHPEKVVSYNNVTNVALPLPTTVVANMSATKNTFAAAIHDYNATVDFGDPIPTSVMINLFDTTRTPAQRLSSFMLYRAELKSKNVLTDAMDRAFLQNINTENAFAGDFSSPQR